MKKVQGDGESRVCVYVCECAIWILNERERKVIQLRYFHALTQQRAAKVLHVSQVQISRIEKKAIALLKELMI